MSWTPRASEAIGGRWAISVPGGVAMAGLLVLSRVLRPLAEGDTGTVAVAMLAATAAGAAVLLLAHATVFRRRAADRGAPPSHDRSDECALISIPTSKPK